MGLPGVVSLAAGLAAASVAAAAPAAAKEGLEQRLQRMEDRLAIEQLLMRYAAALNTKDADTYVSLFAPDGSLEIRRSSKDPAFIGPFKGRAALRKQWFPDGQGFTGAWGPMRHVTTNIQIDVQGDRATDQAFFIEMVSTGDNSPPGAHPPAVHAMGRYEDELVKIGGMWFFAKRVVVIDMNVKWTPDAPTDARR